MLPRPFRTEIRRERLPADGYLQVIVRTSPEVSLTPETREAFERPFKDLATAGQWGAMAGDRFRPAASRVQLLESAEPADSRELMWTFGVTNVHPGILLVIENLVHFLHLNFGRVELLRIQTDLLSPGEMIPGELPVDYEPYPFTVEYNQQTAQVLVDVDFAGRHEPQDLQQFREAWTAWEGLAAFGGFADATYHPGRASLAVEDELQLTSTGLSGAYDDVAIADAGFYCLVNMLETFHHTLAPIASVVIE